MAKGRKTGGRVKGSLNVAQRDVRAVARALIEDPAYVDALRVRLLEGQAAPVEALIWHYAYGKPVDTTALVGADGEGPPRHIIEHVYHDKLPDAP
jgi:hypothetical protein